MNKVKILLSEEPTLDCECPFYGWEGCVLTTYGICGDICMSECYCTREKDTWGNRLPFDFSKCPFCVALNKVENEKR